MGAESKMVARLRTDILMYGGVGLSLLLVALTFAFYGTGFYTVAVSVTTVLLAAASAALFYRQYASLARAKAKGSEAGIFLALAAAMSLWAAAEIVWAYYQAFLGESPEISIADALWFIGYIPLIAAMFMKFDTIRFSGRVTVVALAVYLIAGAAVFVMLKDIMVDSEVTLEGNLVNLAYVLGDTILISLGAVIFIAFLAGSVRVSWALLGLAVIFGMAGDILFTQVFAAGEWVPGSLIDILFMLNYLWFAVAALVNYEEASGASG